MAPVMTTSPMVSAPITTAPFVSSPMMTQGTVVSQPYVEGGMMTGETIISEGTIVDATVQQSPSDALGTEVVEETVTSADNTIEPPVEIPSEGQ